MSREIEAKLRVESHEPIRVRLRELGATMNGTVLETNWIYDRADGSLRRCGCGLRIRSSESLSGRRAEATLTFKGPIEAGPFKSREELELRISNADTANGILKALSFVVVLCYQKRRQQWRYRDCRIELDEPPHIGLFVEIEGPDEAAIRTTQGELSLGSASHVRASYVRMLMAYCQEHEITDGILLLSEPRASGE